MHLCQSENNLFSKRNENKDHYSYYPTCRGSKLSHLEYATCVSPFFGWSLRGFKKVSREARAATYAIMNALPHVNPLLVIKSMQPLL